MQHGPLLLFKSIALFLSTSGAAAKEAGGIEEIVVTAQKAAESLRLVPQHLHPWRRLQRAHA